MDLNIGDILRLFLFDLDSKIRHGFDVHAFFLGELQLAFEDLILFTSKQEYPIGMHRLLGNPFIEFQRSYNVALHLPQEPQRRRRVRQVVRVAEIIR